jgi:hypothetical protein
MAPAVSEVPPKGRWHQLSAKSLPRGDGTSWQRSPSQGAMVPARSEAPKGRWRGLEESPRNKSEEREQDLADLTS